LECSEEEINKREVRPEPETLPLELWRGVRHGEARAVNGRDAGMEAEPEPEADADADAGEEAEG
jgi:hypothetical protein